MRNESEVVEFVDWETFLSERFKWRQGEHVSLIGPTGGGKTTLALELIERRKFVVVVGTKPRDSTLAKLKGRGFRIVRQWPDHVATDVSPRLVFWPRVKGPSDLPKQQKAIAQGLASMFAQGGWCIVVDEAFYLSKTLRLAPVLEFLWTQGRSVGISVVAATQKPSHVPLHMYNQATHLFLWRDSDRRNLDRLGDISSGSIDPASIREAISRLPKYHVVYVNTRTGEIVETRVDLD